MREFLKPTKLAVFLAVVLVGALAFTGCDSGGGGGTSWDMRFDVVVVGAGAAGMPAALAASDALGSEGTVLLIEASSAVGGGFAMAAGGWNGAISAANADNDIVMAWGTTYGDTAFGQTGFPRTERLPDWNNLARIGGWGNHVRFTLFGSATPRGRWDIPIVGAGTGMHLYANVETGVTGPGFIGGMHGANSMRVAVEARNPTTGTHPNADLRNLTLMTNTRGTRLIRTGGTVSGVRAESTVGNDVFNIRASKVILATGGFTGNNQLMYDYLDWDAVFTHNDAPLNNPGLRTLLAADWYRGVVPATHQGDGFFMAREVGADKAHRWTAGGGIAGIDLEFVATLPAAIQPVFRGQGVFMGNIGLQMQNAIVVNGEGRRFANENAALQFGSGGFGTQMVNNGLPPFHIIYTSLPRTNVIGGETLDIVAALNTAANVTTGDFRYEVLRANTLAELAAMMGVPEANFLATIETYNTNVVAALGGTENADAITRDGFGKPNTQMTIQYLDGVNGPFFAVRIYPGAISSWGSLRVDWRGRVLREDNTTIPNLYAAGEVAFRDFFAGGYVGGTALTIGPIQGFIAGTDAGRLVLGQSPIPSLVTDCEYFDPTFDLSTF